MRTHSLSVLVLGCCFVLGMAAASRGAVVNDFGTVTPRGFYVPHRGAYASTDECGIFYFRDPASLPATEIINPGPPEFCNGAFSPNGTFYGTERFHASRLFKMDPTTGNYAQVGTFAGDLMIVALAIDRLGRAVGFNSSGFYEINLQNATATQLSTAHWDNLQSIAFDSAGRLFGTTYNYTWLYEFDPSNGFCLTSRKVASLDIYYDQAGIAFGPNGEMYFGRDRYNTGDSGRLMRVDPTTLQVVDLGAYARYDYDDKYSYVLAYYPEPATLSLLATGALALLFRKRGSVRGS